MNKKVGVFEMGYLICDKCRGYYKLQPGELPADFTDKCPCGGNLRFGMSRDVVGENKSFQTKQRNTEQNEQYKKTKPKNEVNLIKNLNI